MSHAPVAFFAFTVIGLLFGWWAANLYYRQRLANSHDQIAICQEQVRTLQTKIEHGTELAVSGFLNSSQAEALVKALAQLPHEPIAIFPFSGYPSTTSQAGALTSAFVAASWRPGSGDAESQPFVTERRGKYDKGLWVVGPQSEEVAAALQGAGLPYVRTDPACDPGITCIVVGR